MNFHFNERDVISSEERENVLGIKQYTCFTVCSPKKISKGCRLLCVHEFID